MELPKKYNAEESEEKWQRFWAERGIFEFNPDAEGEIYTVDTPPPTVSGKMHIGHAMSYAQQDILVRYQRMKGRNVFYPFGTDDNGLPTERLVEKKKDVDSHEMERSQFRQLCLDTIEEIKPSFIQDWKEIGMSCDFGTTYSTLDESSQRLSQESFIDLFKKGHVVREESPVTWCTNCRTAIAQAEFENVEMNSHFHDLIFKSGGKELEVATTRPELLPACVALFYHPGDERYEGFEGEFDDVPLLEYEVPILTDESVDKEKGSGLMMVCTFGDKEDVEKWRKYDLPLYSIIEEDGSVDLGGNPEIDKKRISELGFDKDMGVKEFRKKITNALKKDGSLVRSEQIRHAVNLHEKCGTEIEFIKTEQWYVEVLKNKEKFLEAGEKIDWHPDHMRVRYEHWVKNLNWDWCVSRQRHFGVPFPLWFCKDCGEVKLAKVENLPVDPLEDSPEESCSCGSDSFVPEEDVLDTWATSSVSPKIALEQFGGEAELPMSMRPQAHDIIRTWAFYTIVKAVYNDDEIPWDDVVISGHALDSNGEKMSKSKGNVVDPDDVLEEYSADALRFWSAGVKLGDDLSFQEKDLVTGKKTIIKLWNAMKFSIMHLEDYDGFSGELAPLDKWVLSKFNKVVEEVTDYFQEYKYSKALSSVNNFFWNTFCDNYLEFVKDRLYNPEEYGEQTLSAKHTLYSVALGVLKLFAPIMPHVTEEIYQLFFCKKDGFESIHISKWPVSREELVDEEAEKVGDLAVEIVEKVRKFKSENQLSLKAEISGLNISSEIDLRGVEKDIIAVTNTKSLSHSDGEFSVEIIE